MDHIFHKVEGWFTFPNLYSYAVKNFGSGSKFIEIGSWLGQSATYMAVEIANSNKDIDFYCVDLWDSNKEYENEPAVVQNVFFETFIKNIEPVKNFIKPIKSASLDAALQFEDEYFDFIFIDAAHDYENVKKDLQAWYPKLKKGGLFAGHDFEFTHMGVMRAVTEWSDLNSKIIGTQENCWFHQKL
jgi:predicted O-methyltransferase YrrM